MKIRRFYGKNMRSALRQVTEEFGQDAAILSSQKTASGVEVIAALDYDQELLPAVLRDKEKRTDNTHSQDIHQLSNANDKVNLEPFIAQQIENKGDVLNHHELNNFKRSFNKADQGSGESATSGSNITSTKQNNQIEWTTDPGLVAMREELGLMRSMMSEQLKGIGWERFSAKDPTCAMLTRQFAELGINQNITSELLPRVTKHQDAECSWQNLLALLAKSISINNHELLLSGGIFAFMGPTGAGKTTTIAKLAARFVIKHGVDSVGLISTDNYRISAQQQLASFSRLLGVPMLSVSAKHSLDTLVNQFKNKKLVLIDTAGMSNKDTDIAMQLASLQKTHQNIKRFLLIPATNQLAVIKQSVELFSCYSPYAVIITKLDEATSLGEVLSIVIQNKLPVAFTTDGQRVPDDIRVARNHHLVSKAVWLTNKFGRNAEDWKLAQQLKQVKFA